MTLQDLRELFDDNDFEKAKIYARLGEDGGFVEIYDDIDPDNVPDFFANCNIEHLEINDEAHVLNIFLDTSIGILRV